MLILADVLAFIVKFYLICFRVQNRQFVMPTLEELKQYRIIVTTLYTASVLSLLGLQKGHFTHIFIDEAAQVLC